MYPRFKSKEKTRKRHYL